MIDRRSLEIDHITQYAHKYGAQREVLERMIRALVLLETLQRLGFSSVFKGGTSLVLTIQPIRRFSVDIDLLVEERLPEPEMQTLLEEVVRLGGFTRVEEDRRIARGIPKQHFRFWYDSVVLSEPMYVLLDLLYEENPYHSQRSAPIAHEVLLQVGEPISVWMPTPAELLGDKLAAFAPRTIGVLAGEENHLSMVKQLFDVEILFDHVARTGGDFDVTRRTFLAIAHHQMAYRGMSSADLPRVYEDIRDAALSLASLGDHNLTLFHELKAGVQALRDHLFTPPKFTLDTAPLAGAKAAWLATLIEKNRPFEAVTPLTDVKSMKPLRQEQFRSAEKRKKGMPQAYAYWMKIDELLTF